MDVIASSVFEESSVLPLLPVTAYGDKEQVLGQGTFGMVYRTSSNYAVKVIKGQDVLKLGLARGVAEREISITISLTHPNVINIIDVSYDSQNIYIVLPLAVTDLAGLIEKKLIPPEKKKPIAYQILSGVAYCLCRNVINRDIKPQNILVYENYIIKIADLGLAKQFYCATELGLTNLVYSLPYRSPEILLGGRYNSRSDVWATGCVLYELYSGDRLFQSLNEDHALFLIFRKFGPAETHWPDVVNYPKWSADLEKVREPEVDTFQAKIGDPSLATIIRSMLQLDPAQRSTIYDAIQNPYFDDVREPEDFRYCSCVEALTKREQYPIPQYGERTGEITFRVRDILFNWLFEVCTTPPFIIETVFLACYCVDYSVEKIKPLKKDFQLLGMAAVLSSANLLGNDRGDLINELVYLSEDSYTKQQVVDFQMVLLSVLKYDLAVSTSFNFLVSMYERYSVKVKKIAIALLFVFTLEGIVFAFLPSDLAVVSLHASCLYNKETFYHVELENESTEQAYSILVERLLVDKGDVRTFERYAGAKMNIIGKELRRQKRKRS